MSSRQILVYSNVLQFFYRRLFLGLAYLIYTTTKAKSNASCWVWHATIPASLLGMHVFIVLCVTYWFLRGCFRSFFADVHCFKIFSLQKFVSKNVLLDRLGIELDRSQRIRSVVICLMRLG